MIFGKIKDHRSRSLDMLSKKDEIERWKARDKPTVIFYLQKEPPAMDLDNEGLEEMIIRASDELKKRPIKFKKVNCRKIKGLDECQLKMSSVFFYQSDDSRRIGSSQMQSTKGFINAILYQMLTSDQNMIHVSNREQLDEVIDMNRGVFNVIVGSFKKLDSDECRNFLEAGMGLGRNFSFVFVTGVKSKNVRTFGHSVAYYHTMDVKEGAKPKKDDLTGYAGSRKDLLAIIPTLEMTAEMIANDKKMKEAKRKQKMMEDEMNRLQEEELKKHTKKDRSLHNLKRSNEDKQKDTKKTLKVQPSLPASPARRRFTTISKDSVKHMQSAFGQILKDHDEELAWDAFDMYNRQNRLWFLKNDYSLNETELTAEISLKKLVVVLFYAPWDPKYQLFQDVFDKVAEKYENHTTIKVAEFNCYAWRDACIRYEINEFPAIFVFKSGMEPFRYIGPLCGTELLQKINFWKQPLLPELSKKEVLRLIDDENIITVLAVLPKEELSHEIEIMKKIALKYYGHLRVAFAKTSKKQLTLFETELSPPEVLAVHANKDIQRVTHTNNFDMDILTKWIEDQQLPLIEELTPLSFPRVAKLKRPLLLFTVPDRKHFSQDVLRDFARNLGTTVATLWIDISTDVSKRIMETYGVKSNTAIVLVDRIEGATYVYKDPISGVNVGLINKWVKACMDGRHKIHYKLVSRQWLGQEGYNFLALSDEREIELQKQKAIEANDKKDDKVDDKSSDSHETTDLTFEGDEESSIEIVPEKIELPEADLDRVDYGKVRYVHVHKGAEELVKKLNLSFDDEEEDEDNSDAYITSDQHDRDEDMKVNYLPKSEL